MYVLIEKELTATSTDVLDGTELSQPQTAGQLKLWVASTVNTATLEVPQIMHQPGKTALIRKRTDGIPDLQADPCFVIPVQQGSRPVVSLGGTTGTCHFTGIFVPGGR